MAGEYFTADVTTARLETVRGAYPAARAHFRLYVIGRGGRYRGAFLTRWDTGADFSAMSERRARRLGIDLEDRDRIDLSGATGVPVEAWIVPRFVIVQGLPGFRFRVPFAVLPGTEFPYLLFGLSDTLRHFETTTRDRRVYFFLKPDHRGEPAAAPERTEP